jgi:hypothetical protein
VYATLKSGGRLVIAAIYDCSNEDWGKDGPLVSQVEMSVIGKFIHKGFSDICPAAEFQAHVAEQSISSNTHHKLKVLQRALKSAGFQDIQFDTQLVWHDFETLDAYMDSREATSWLPILSFPAQYRENARLRLRDMFRTAWDEISEEQGECPIQDKWPVVFIQAKKE